MAKVEVYPSDRFSVEPSRAIWQYRGGSCRLIKETQVRDWMPDERRNDTEEDVSPAFAIGAMNAWGHEVTIVGELPPSPEVTRRDEERRDNVALEALKVIIATGYKDAAQAAASAYELADAMEAARKGGGGG